MCKCISGLYIRWWWWVGGIIKIQLSRAENCCSFQLDRKIKSKKKRKKTREPMIFRDAIFRLLLLFEIYITDGSSSRELEKVWNVGRRRRRHSTDGRTSPTRKSYTCQLHKSFCFSLYLFFAWLLLLLLLLLYTCDDDPFSLLFII